MFKQGDVTKEKRQSISPERSMGSFSRDLRTWSDSPVRELSSIFRSLPWIKIPSAGRRSPDGKENRVVNDCGMTWRQRKRKTHWAIQQRLIWRPWRQISPVALGHPTRRPRCRHHEQQRSDSRKPVSMSHEPCFVSQRRLAVTYDPSKPLANSIRNLPLRFNTKAKGSGGKLCFINAAALIKHNMPEITEFTSSSVTL